MPIKREHKMFYPAEWISLCSGVKNDSGGKCRFCSVPDRAFIRRLSRDKRVWRLAEDVRPWEESEFEPSIQVVLSCAHLDHLLVNHDRSNLVPLCQRCHVVFDKGYSGVVDPRPLAFQFPPKGGGG